MPYGVWEKQVAQQIHTVSGSNVQTLSYAVSSAIIPTDKRIRNKFSNISDDDIS